VPQLGQWDRSDRYDVVIGLIAVCYVMTASLPTTNWQGLVLLVQLVTLRVTFSVSESARAQRAAVVLFGTLAVVVGLVSLATGGDESVATAAVFAVSALMYVVSPAVIVRHIFSRPAIDRQTLLGAVAAYLFIGMGFAFLFMTTSLLQPDQPFFGDEGRGSITDHLFFSFTTLTTTGYGNLTPAANPGQSFALLEMILGQLFLVTAVARIVAGWVPRWGLPGSGPDS
jgi:hypothetical protein